MMRARAAVAAASRAIALCALVAAAGCRTAPAPGPLRPQRRSFAELHMGMSARIDLYAPSDAAAREAARAAFARIAQLEDVMSDYRPESELRRLERHPPDEWVPVSAELYAVLARAVQVARATGGAFDPTVGPLVALWREARRTGRLPGPAALDSARALVGWQRLSLDSTRRAVRLGRAGVRLDLGGIAKGYILQDALATLRAHGVASALLQAGGDIVAGDAPPGGRGWRIAAPGADRALARRAGRLAGAAIAISGPSEQFLEVDGVRYSHVVDPRTGLGLTSRASVRVIAPDGATADALATALSVLDPREHGRVLRQFPGVEASVTGIPEGGGPSPGRARMR